MLSGDSGGFDHHGGRVDQVRLRSNIGHKKRKPTTLMAANAPGLPQLHGVTGDGSGEGAATMSRSWAQWSPRMTAARVTEDLPASLVGCQEVHL